MKRESLSNNPKRKQVQSERPRRPSVSDKRNVSLSVKDKLSGLSTTISETINEKKSALEERNNPESIDNHSSASRRTVSQRKRSSVSNNGTPSIDEEKRSEENILFLNSESNIHIHENSDSLTEGNGITDDEETSNELSHSNANNSNNKRGSSPSKRRPSIDSNKKSSINKDASHSMSEGMVSALRLNNNKTNKPIETSLSYSYKQGQVMLLDGRSLTRKQYLSDKQKRNLTKLILIGIVLGLVISIIVAGLILNNNAKKADPVTENLKQSVEYNIPQLTSLIGETDDAIKASFSEAGYVTKDITQSENFPNGGFEVFKFPSTLKQKEAQALYEKGINNLDAGDASLLLNGSWLFGINRTNPVSTYVKYVDFTSNSIETALNNTMTQQGFSADTITAEGGKGVDESGNTYITGSTTVNNTQYTWRVSATLFSSVYSIGGMPANAYYVGIRLTED